MKNEKEITIKDVVALIRDVKDGLLGLEQKMNAGFASSDKKFVGLEQKMNFGFAEADRKMAARFIEADKKTDAKIEDLASMIKREFDDVAVDIKTIKENMERMEAKQEGIELRQDNVAYRFEIKELKGRVDVLEKKAGIKIKG